MRRRLFVLFAASLIVGTLHTTAGATATSPVDARSRVVDLAKRGAARYVARLRARRAPFRSSATVQGADPAGDADDPRGDITQVSASYGPHHLGLRARVAEPTNPATDALWRDGFAVVEFGIDTGGDDMPEYVAFFSGDGRGHVFAGVLGIDEDVLIGDPTGACPSARAKFVNSAFVVTASPTCLGNAPRIRVQAFMLVASDPDTDTPSFDIAPDDEFIGPLTGPQGGYILTASDGGVFTYGNTRFRGSTGGVTLAQPITDVAGTPGVLGYAMVAADGGVFPFGNVAFSGSAVSLHTGKRFVAIATTRSGRGYWLVSADGGVFAFGTAAFKGSASGMVSPADPVVGIAPTPTGRGYWLATANGSVFSFGDATFQGSAASLGLRQPIVAIAPTPSGDGYLLVAADGGVFTFGDAKFYGSTGALRLVSPIVDAAMTATGVGYRLFAADGGVFSYGDAKFFGSAAGIGLHAPIVAAAGF